MVEGQAHDFKSFQEIFFNKNAFLFFSYAKGMARHSQISIIERLRGMHNMINQIDTIII